MLDLRLLPKAHLHVHAESTIRPTTLAELAARHGVELGPRRRAFTGFRDFADHNARTRACLREPGDFTRIGRELIEDEAAQGTVHVDVTFTAASHGERLGEPEMPLDALLTGLRGAAARTGTTFAVILDHSRRRSVARFARTVALAGSRPEVRAVGLAGDEAHPLAPFAGVIADSGIAMVHHAGETAGPESVREALGLGRAVRIGHGLRVLEDRELVAELRDRRVPLEVCPSSNTALGLVPFGAHPLPRMIEAGLVVTLNTDVPDITGHSLVDEYALVRDVYGASDGDLEGLALASLRAALR
ncbi:adenosine deaminase family protein [Pseudonocardia sp. WMMC193]|uniref:adenosine deaminase family protein n=1 Tax=Pseudonocardia sp. WMMC193 TaxID=2911965 RepID=UPI001F385E52|nr:adenosine deaminase family protein [Pseudonocardia sp. WMMC193]MCF7551022.1 adenosine deaminase family protein [Pseudonocardia sp. WMMC193]